MVYQPFLDAYKQIGISLRKSGSIDFYYDFKLVETSEGEPGKREFTAIDIDFKNIHFKCYEYEKDPRKDYDCCYEDNTNKSKAKRKFFEYSCFTSWK